MFAPVPAPPREKPPDAVVAAVLGSANPTGLVCCWDVVVVPKENWDLATTIKSEIA